VNWRVKGLVQKCLSSTPGGVWLNTRLQHILGGMQDFDANVGIKVDDWTLSMGYLTDVSFRVSGARLMEIGTGWHPTFPLCFVLVGAGSVATFDIVRLLGKRATFRLINSLEKHIPTIASLAGESADIIHARLLELRRPKSLGELLSKSNIEYFAPADGRATGLEPNSIDLVYSNSVLEHVPREVISGLMEESFRVLRPGGLAMHNVGCNDHYAFFDKSISFVNYLQYEERDWRLWNNSLQYQNRLRAPEFLELAMQAGFEVINNRTHVRPGTLEALAGLRVAPQFERFSRDELTATTTDFIVRKPER
jgi:SAM-dependent methyltransferase